MSILEQIKKIIDTNSISDKDILDLREYTNNILTTEEYKLWQESNQSAEEQHNMEQYELQCSLSEE